MKKLVIVLAMLGLMFNVIGCKAKKAQDDTEIIENADVEKIEAEEANFAGNEATLQTGPVDESLQAALGETPSEESVATTPSTDPVTDSLNAPSTEVVSTEVATPDVAAAPTIDESALTAPPTTTTTEVAANDLVDSGISETPVLDNTVPPVEIAQTQTDTNMMPETPITGGVTEMNGTPPLADNSIMESSLNPPVDASTVISTERAEKFTSDKVTVSSSSKTASSKNQLVKIADTVPYQHGDGYVNTVYMARPKEKLADISSAIYGVDKLKELKEINAFLKNRGPRAGEKIYYISPNRPADSSRTISFYEDTGMIASNYTSEKGENLNKISKKLLGYDNAWKEVWTTNSLESKSKLAKGETIRYWKGKDIAPTPTLANLEGNSKLVDSVEQMPAAPTQVAMNASPPSEPTSPTQMTNELPPPPPMDPAMDPAMNNAPPAEAMPPQAEMANQELPPPPTQEMAPPPPPSEEMAAAPMPPKQKGTHNMEEEPTAEEGSLTSDTTMMIGVVAVLVSLLGIVLIRRNKKKKEAELASIERTHVGS